jgi:hypothetical protein
MVSNEERIMDEAVCSRLRVMEAFVRYDEGKDEVDYEMKKGVWSQAEEICLLGAEEDKSDALEENEGK